MRDVIIMVSANRESVIVYRDGMASSVPYQDVHTIVLIGENVNKYKTIGNVSVIQDSLGKIVTRSKKENVVIILITI